MKTTLTPVDFSPGTRETIAEATALTRDLRARLILLHVIEPLPPAANAFGFVETPPDFTDEAEAQAVRRLEHVQRQLVAAGVSTSTFHMIGVPGPSILEHARRVGADYIVLGSHGHGAFYELMVGSTANRVLKEARCPVLIVPRGTGRAHRMDALNLDALEAVEA